MCFDEAQEAGERFSAHTPKGRSRPKTDERFRMAEWLCNASGLRSGRRAGKGYRAGR